MLNPMNAYRERGSKSIGIVCLANRWKNSYKLADTFWVLKDTFQALERK
jgi:hypothetical protein